MVVAYGVHKYMTDISLEIQGRFSSYIEPVIVNNGLVLSPAIS